MNKIVFGIDFGTTYSVVAYNTEDGSINTLRDVAGRTLYPSVVSYIDGVIHTGFSAEGKDNAIYSIKRLIGKEWGDEVCRIFSHPLDPGPDGNIYINANGRWITVEDIVCDILRSIKRRTEYILNVRCIDVVITVPARFNDKARSIIKLAAKKAGLKVIRLINEPTAAAIAYGIENEADGIYCVYDLGGGTFDFSVLSMSNNIFHVLATGGSLNIGGDDLDMVVMKKTKCKDIRIARSIREQLSTSENIEFKGFEITREEFDRGAKSIIKETIKISEQIIRESGISKSDISGIIMVGGVTKTPLVMSSVSSAYKSIKIYSRSNPEEIVAIGAAHHANAIMKSKQHLLLDVVTSAIGVEAMGGEVDVIIPRQTPLPVTAYRVYTTSYTGQTSIQFNIVQGDKKLAKECESLGVFEVNNITPLEKNIARVKLEINADIEGQIHILAYEEGKKDKVEITLNTVTKKDNDDEFIENTKDYLIEVREEIKYLLSIGKIKDIEKAKYLIDRLIDLDKYENINSLKNEVDTILVSLINS